MAKFAANTAVEAIEYDLRPYVDKSGIIPEPTQGEVEAFMQAALSAAKKLGVKPGEGMESIDPSQIDEEAAQGLYNGMVEAMVGLTGGEITAEDLGKLPFRVQTAFFQWITLEINPNPQAPATKR